MGWIERSSGEGVCRVADGCGRTGVIKEGGGAEGVAEVGGDTEVGSAG